MKRIMNAGFLLLLGVLAWVPMTGLAIDPIPSCQTLFFNTYYPKAGQTRMDIDPGVVRTAASTYYEGWWQEESYYQMNPVNGLPLRGFYMRSKTYGEKALPWTHGLVSMGSTVVTNVTVVGSLTNSTVVTNALMMPSPKSWINLAPIPGQTKFDPTFGGEHNRELDYQGNSHQRYGGTGPLLDGFWTPGERFSDTMLIPGQPPNGIFDNFIQEDYWQSSNTNYLNVPINESSIAQALAGRVDLYFTPYPNKKDTWDGRRGEYYADYDNMTEVNAATTLVTSVEFNDNTMIYIADTINKTNVPIAISDFTVDPPVKVDHGIIPSYYLSEGDLTHTVVPGQPGTGVSVPQNGEFDYDVDSVNVGTPLVYPALGNGEVAKYSTNLVWVTYQSYLSVDYLHPSDPTFATPYLNKTDYYQYPPINGVDGSGSPAASSYAWVGVGSKLLCTVHVLVYQAGELWGVPLQANLPDDAGGLCNTYYDYRGNPAKNPYPDPAYPGDDKWTYHDHEDYEDFISWWNPKGGQSAQGCWVDAIVGAPMTATNHLGPTPISKHMGNPTSLNGLTYGEYINYIANNYPGDVTGLIARCANGVYDGPDDWVEVANTNADGTSKSKYIWAGDSLTIKSPEPGQYGASGWDPDNLHGGTWQGWWTATYGLYSGTNVPGWEAKQPQVTPWTVNPPTDPVHHMYPPIIVGTNLFVNQGVALLLPVYTNQWYPPKGSTWGYQGPREYEDLPSSIYHGGVGIGGNAGDLRLGEQTDPWTYSISGVDHGLDDPSGPNITPDKTLPSSGPLAYDVHGTDGLDAGNQLNIELLTWCTDGKCLTGPRATSAQGSTGEHSQPAYNHDNRDCNLDGLIDIGETIPDKSQNYSIDSNTSGLKPDGGRQTTYPFNWDRYFEDCIAAWDDAEDFNAMQHNNTTGLVESRIQSPTGYTWVNGLVMSNWPSSGPYLANVYWHLKPSPVHTVFDPLIDDMWITVGAAHSSYTMEQVLHLATNIDVMANGMAGTTLTPVRYFDFAGVGAFTTVGADFAWYDANANGTFDTDLVLADPQRTMQVGETGNLINYGANASIQIYYQACNSGTHPNSGDNIWIENMGTNVTDNVGVYDVSSDFAIYLGNPAALVDGTVGVAIPVTSVRYHANHTPDAGYLVGDDVWVTLGGAHATFAAEQPVFKPVSFCFKHVNASGAEMVGSVLPNVAYMAHNDGGSYKYALDDTWIDANGNQTYDQDVTILNHGSLTNGTTGTLMSNVAWIPMPDSNGVVHANVYSPLVSVGSGEDITTYGDVLWVDANLNHQYDATTAYTIPVYCEGWACAGVGAAAASTNTGGGESSGPSGNLVIGPHLAHYGFSTATRDGVNMSCDAHLWPANLGFGGASHEQGHDLIGWGDYYDYGRFGSDQGIIHMPVDAFDLMAQGGLVHGIGDTKLAFVTPQLLNTGTSPLLVAPDTGVHTLKIYPCERYPDQYYWFVNPNAPFEAFCFYYMAGISTYSAVGSGLVIEHDNSGTPFGHPEQQRANYNFFASIVEADGKYHMEDGVNPGEQADLWGGKNNGIWGGPTTVFNETTIPPARWWDQSQSGVRITDIRLPANQSAANPQPVEVDFEWVSTTNTWFWTGPSGAAAATTGGGTLVTTNTVGTNTVVTTNAIAAASNAPGVGVGLGGGFFTPLAGASRSDSNGNGIPDAWEYYWFGRYANPLGICTATSDWDGDGLPDYAEWLAHLNPMDKWSWDNDTSTAITDANADLTGDHLSNLTKYQMGLNMREPDSDDDGWSDSQELNPAIVKPDQSGVWVTTSTYTGLARRVTCPLYSRSPLIERSLYLSATDQLSIPSWEINDYTRFQTTNWTVEGWIRLNATNEIATLVKRTTPQGGVTFEVGVTNNVAYASFRTDAGNTYRAYPSNGVAAAFATGVWHHVAGAFSLNTSSLRIYIDGQVAGSATVLEAPPLGVATMLNGANTTGSVKLGGGLNGYVDEVRIWASARTALQIQKEFDKIVNSPWVPGYIVINGVSTVVTTIVNSVGNDGTLISNLRFDDGQNTTITNALDGTVHSAGIEDWVHPLGPNEGVYWNGSSTGDRVNTHGYSVMLSGNAAFVADTNIVKQMRFSDTMKMPYDDLNEDGIPDWWQVMYWPNFNPEQSGPWDASADPNGNGLSNLQDYLADNNPLDSTGSLGGSGVGTNTPPITPVSTVADSDGDGIPDYWELQYYLDPSLYDSQQDSDADGWDNYSEYMAGTSPINSGSYPRPPLYATFWYSGSTPISTINIESYTTPTRDGAPDAVFSFSPSSGQLQIAGTVVVVAQGAAGDSMISLGSGSANTILPGPTYLQGTGLAAGTYVLSITTMGSGSNSVVLASLSSPLIAALPVGTALTALKPQSLTYPMTFLLTNAVLGHLRSGPNYFFAYANPLVPGQGNQYVPGQPCGYAVYQPINVSWSAVAVDFNLQTAPIGFPRFSWNLPTGGATYSRVQVDYGYSSGSTNYTWLNVADITLHAPRTTLTEADLIYLGKTNGMGTPTKTTDWFPIYRWSVMFDPAGASPVTYAPSTSYTVFTQRWTSATFTQPTIVHPLNETVHLLPLDLEWTAGADVPAFTLTIRSGSTTGTVVMSATVRPTSYVGSGGTTHYVYYPQWASSQFLQLTDGTYFWQVAPSVNPALGGITASAWSQFTLVTTGGAAGSLGPFSISGTMVYTGKVANHVANLSELTGVGSTKLFTSVSLTNSTYQPNFLPIAGTLTLQLRRGVTNLLTFTDTGANLTNLSSVTLLVDTSRTQVGWLSSTCLVNYVAGKITSVTFQTAPTTNDHLLATYDYQGYPFIVQAYPLFNVPGWSGKPWAQSTSWKKGAFSLSGLSSGAYTLVGFIDEIGDGMLHAPPESWGFVRGTVPSSGPGYQQIQTITVAASVAGAAVTLQDVDSDNDGLPDAWEIEMYGSIGAHSGNDVVNGVALSSTYAASIAASSPVTAWDVVAQALGFGSSYSSFALGNPSGITALEAYISGDFNGNTQWTIPTITTDGSGHPLIAWNSPVVPMGTQIRYTVYRTTDLAAGWTPVVPDVMALSGDAPLQRSFVDLNAPVGAFYKLQASVELAP